MATSPENVAVSNVVQASFFIKALVAAEDASFVTLKIIKSPTAWILNHLASALELLLDRDNQCAFEVWIHPAKDSVYVTISSTNTLSPASASSHRK